MKYKFTLKHHFTTLAEGVIETKIAPDTTPSQMRHEEQELLSDLFDVEQAINAHTDLRAHIELID